MFDSPQITQFTIKPDDDIDSDDDNAVAADILANLPKAKYTGYDNCKDDSTHLYQLNGWSLAGAQRIKELTSLVVHNRLQYSLSFDRRMRKFVEYKQTADTSKSKKRKHENQFADVIVIQSDLELDPSAMFPEHNATDYADENDALMQLNDEEHD